MYYLHRIIVNLGTHYMYYDIFLLHHLFGLENEPQVYIHFLIFYRISLVRRAKKCEASLSFLNIFQVSKNLCLFFTILKLQITLPVRKKIEKKPFFSKFAKNNLEFKFHPTNSFVLLEQLSKSL